MLLPQLSQAATAEYASIVLNGTKLSAVYPVINGSTMVPMYVVSQDIGAQITWDNVQKKATIVKEGINIQLTLDKTTAIVNSNTAQMRNPPIIMDNRVLVPISFVASTFGYTIGWDNSTKTATLTSKQAISGVEWSGNTLTVRAAGPVQPKIGYVANPDRLTVDVPQAAFSGALPKPAPGQEGHLSVADNPQVKEIRYSYYDPATSTIRIVVDLKGTQAYDVLQTGTAGIIQVKLTPSTAKYKVVIDPGHGDFDNGATSITGRYEKDFNLSMGLKVFALLKQVPQIQPYLTRSDDTFITLAGRTSFANNLPADVFVSIHGNAFPNNPDVNGVETFYNRSGESVTLANIMHAQLLKSTGFADRNVRFGDLHVIRETTMPAVLLEVGYLSNAMNESMMYTDGFQNRVAQSIVDGIKQFLKIQ
jgi:N-acetylmuramoyl-L-alanine amidase